MGSSTLGTAKYGHLFNCEEYSDLTLVCQAREFLVHKVVVCTQSPFMAAAVRGPFQEATLGIIQVEDFEVETVRRMVEFLYTGDYDAPPHPSEAIEEEAITVQPLALRNETNDKILRHVRVAVIADYYNIKDLSSLACTKVKSSISAPNENHPSPQALADAVKEASTLCDDNNQDLQDTITTFAAANLNILLQADDLNPLFNDFGVEIIKKLMQKCETLETQLKDTTKGLRAIVESQKQALAALNRARVQEARTSASVTKCLAMLREQSRCRNGQCGALFECYVEGNGHYPVYTLRCAKCGCRH
ncbi:hypothetical protein B0T14DRAFT_424596 [Immersiella caudata]|uniref:BTB domain-containing protein n=1 Tax=Immersiella caudata TaxID=314043 RepID=A0AA40C723_9PEZI|nr:hypothetical protein B0T14DRAFT_424596 [Immersiella caudata]